MAEELHPKDGLEEYLINAFEGYEDETPSDSVWQHIEGGLPAPVAPAGAIIRPIAWKWAAGIAASLLFGGIGWTLLTFHQKIETLSGIVEDKTRQIEALSGADSISRSLPAPSLALSSDKSAAAAQTPPSLSPQRREKAPILPRTAAAPESEITIYENGVVPEPEPESVAASTSFDKVPDPLPLHPRATLLPLNASAPAFKLVPEKQRLSKNIAIKAVYAWQVRQAAHEDHGNDPRQSFSPGEIRSQTDMRAGLGIRLRDNHIVSFETGLEYRYRAEEAVHRPRFRYRRGPGGSQFEYQLLTPGNANKVSVTLAGIPADTIIPENEPIELSIKTRQVVSSINLPLAIRLSTPTAPLQGYIRAGALLQYRISERLEIVEASTSSPYFSFPGDNPPNVAPSTRQSVSAGVVMGVGGSWRANRHMSISAEPYLMMSASRQEGHMPGLAEGLSSNTFG
ncbi:MAG: hypothetical protein EAZ89_01125, partial [Bacteroidetes bacterium]